MARVSKMQKRANKNSTKGRGKRWKKGQSSSFNPECKKHRLAAKKMGFFTNQGEGKLTEAVLAQHNEINADKLIENIEGAPSIGGDTAVTAFTNCSLTAFNRLIKNWNAKSMLHKEMVAALAAVTEVLKSNGGKETETEYFAALMTTLDVVDTDEAVTAVVCLLFMIIKKVNEDVLKSKYEEACGTFTKLLIKYMNSDHCALLRNLLNIVYIFLKTKPSKQWSESSTELNVVLEYTTHHKPKVRKVANNIVRALLNDPNSETSSPKFAPAIAKFCIERLENSAAKTDSKETSRVLSLIQEIIDCFPTISIKKCCETIFKIMTLSNSIVTLCGFKTLRGLFQKQKNEHLSTNLNAQIITALYDYQPNIKDSDCLITWLELMQKALIHLKGLDEKLCLSHLSKFFGVAVKCWQNESEDVMRVIASTLKNLLQDCIDPESEACQEQLRGNLNNNSLYKMFHCVESSMSLQYLKAWNHVLLVLSVFFEVLGKYGHSAMMKCLQFLADLHEIYPLYAQEIEKTIGDAIQHIGPRIVLQAIPLDIEENKSEFRRCWMISLLRDNVKKTELSFFVDYFMPLAAKFKARAAVFEKGGKLVQAKLNSVLVSQIWSLLPSFCNEPTDLEECFSGVAETLGLLLKNDPSVRMTVLSSLRILISKNIKNESPDKEEDSKKKGNIKKIAVFSKNYLPIIFNVYTTEPKNAVQEKIRLAAYETCKLFLQIANAEECTYFYEKTKSLLILTDISEFRKHSLIDLCKAMLPYVDITKVEDFYNYCKPLLTHSNHTTQKKCYSVIKTICGCPSMACQTFIEANLQDLQQLLTKAKGGLIPATRALRLMCLKVIVTRLNEDKKSYILDLIPEVVLQTKDSSPKSRAAAYDLLVAIGIKLKEFNPDNAKEAIVEYMGKLLAGLAGSPHAMSATILSICRIMYEFKDDLDHEIIEPLIENMCTLVSSKAREVVEASLSFFKILFATMSTADLAQYVGFLVNCIGSICQDNQRHFRFKAKSIFTRLVRKFGYPMISKMAPEIYKSQLVNIRKREEKKKRNLRIMKGEESDAEETYSKKRIEEFDDILADSDEGEELDFDVKSSFSKSHRKKIHAPCIEENADDIVDLLDPAVNKTLLTTKQEEKTKSKKSSINFSTAEDGRMIIEDKEPKKNNKEKDEKSAILAQLDASLKKGKRKHRESDSEDENKPLKHSGTHIGIHRSLAPKHKKLRPGEEFRSKKAGGDVKKGTTEPYAYLPLNRQVLNKRKQGKLKGQYKNIVKAAKRGAIVGTKRKSKGIKKRKTKM